MPFTGNDPELHKAEMEGYRKAEERWRLEHPKEARAHDRKNRFECLVMFAVLIALIAGILWLVYKLVRLVIGLL